MIPGRHVGSRAALALAFLLISGCRGRFWNRPAFDSFEVAGTRIRYFTAGAGEPVVLIHGLDSSAVSNWKAPGIVDLQDAGHLSAVAKTEFRDELVKWIEAR